MAEVVRMPKLSDTMSEGVVAEWHKKVGDSVEPGDVLAEIETDKATMEFESFQEGVLLHIGVEKGKAAPVDSILAILGEKGEDIKSILEEEAAKVAESNKVEPKKEESKPAVVSPPVVTPVSAPVKTVSAPQPVVDKANGRIVASPLAKKLAEEKGINLSMVRGTGEGGRIVKRDIDSYSGGASTFIGRESFSDVPASQMRKVIARRLAESKFSAPHFYLTMEIDMDAAIDARKSINEVAPLKISFNDIIIKAVSEGIIQNPKVNASWQGESVRYADHIHIGVAVAVDDGLVVPVVQFADGKTLTQISTQVKDLAVKAKTRKLQPQEMEGNTFTISNLGMFGIEQFTSIINIPEACILSVGAIKQVPVVKNGQIVPGNVMKVTLACDHRAVDGAIGSAFLKTFKQLMESPVLLLGARSI
ncbi:MAG: 2-oxo acid dehydrogenase subunit E2 [Flavobacteriales bacterium]|nr:2-oxo acid dehydrogenase subunit E2 [Flavobacteriales bacterium]